MSLHITDTAITSDEVGQTAHRRDGRWYIAGAPPAGSPVAIFNELYDLTRPSRTFDRDQAISAMTLAEELARPAPNALLVESLRSELR
jgi:hypothetical protein